MEALAGLMVLGIVVFVLTFDWNDEDTSNHVQLPQVQARPTGKIVEATETSTEGPDGTIVTVRKIRQWH